MYKIAISGKVNSGKSTVADLFSSVFLDRMIHVSDKVQQAALADPIKEMIMIMFPRTNKETLYGPSKNRSEVIPGAYKDAQPLTYRKLLQELGTEVGRGYKSDIWLDVMDHKAEVANRDGTGLFIVTDVRFRNEFDHLKSAGYFMVRVTRDSQLALNHSSETEQESIRDIEFNAIIKNDGTLEQLKDKVSDALDALFDY
jgi:hypothetical protein